MTPLRQFSVSWAVVTPRLYQTVKEAPSRGWKLMLAGDGCSAGAVDQTACTCEQLSSQAEVPKPSIQRASGRTRISPPSHQMYHFFPFTKTTVHVWQQEEMNQDCHF